MMLQLYYIQILLCSLCLAEQAQSNRKSHSNRIHLSQEHAKLHTAGNSASRSQWVLLSKKPAHYELPKNVHVYEYQQIGRYHLYVFSGPKRTIHSHIMNNDFDHVLFTPNVPIEAGPGRSSVHLHDEFHKISLPTGKYRRNGFLNPAIQKNTKTPQHKSPKHGSHASYADPPKHNSPGIWKQFHPTAGDRDSRTKNSKEPSTKTNINKSSRRKNPHYVSPRYGWLFQKTDEDTRFKSQTRLCRHAPNVVNRGYLPGAFSWGLDRIDRRPLALDGTFCVDFTGQHVHGYVVDTGVANHITFRFEVQQDYSYYDSGHIPNGDCNGHGTHVAGILASEVYGVAPDVVIHSIKVLDCNGDGSFASLLAGLVWINENVPSTQRTVINLSLGANHVQSTSIEDIIDNLVLKHGFMVVASAGNFKDDTCTAFPAKLTNVMAIGATDAFDRKAGFSNEGPCTDIFAPGVEIISTRNDSTGSLILSGTSMSSPMVAGFAAILLEQNPQYSPENIRNIIINHATRGFITKYNLRSNTPNRLSYLTTLENNPAPADREEGIPNSTSTISKKYPLTILNFLMLVSLAYLYLC